MSTTLIHCFILVLVLVLWGCVISWAQEFSETEEERTQRMAWWHEARFGLFIHWGLYAIPAGEWKGERIPGIGEWIMNRAKIDAQEYEKLTAQFNPVKFDAEEWVRLAKEAGMKYIVITSKHHDGFAMYHSKASPYNIVDATPFDRDPLKELSEACNEQGIKLGFYYSQAQDWHHPGGAGNTWDKEMPRVSMEEYIREKAAPQVREILTHYGDVAILWWDTPRDMTQARADMLRPLIKLQPGIITNNRLGGGYEGDYSTPEQHIPHQGDKERDWETCMTMNDTWGYKHYDHNWKSTEDLIHKLVDIVSKGGNFLLNVGPTAEGLIPEPSITRLKEIGKWIKVNGDSIYGAGMGPFGPLQWGRVTCKPGKLYVHVFEWPMDRRVLLPGLQTPVKKAWFLAEPDRKLDVNREEMGWVIHTPAKPLDAMDTVLVLEIDGEPQVIIPPIVQDQEGHVFLPALKAEVHGKQARYESGGGKDNIGYWTDKNDWVSWSFKIDHPGTFKVEMEYAVPDDVAGSEFMVSVADSEIRGVVEPTGDWVAFKRFEVGQIELKAKGEYQLSVKPKTLPGGAVMNLKALCLRCQ